MIVLDTHVWYRWVTPADPLPAPIQSLIARADAVVVSAISIWEIARLAQRGRIDLKRDIRVWLPIALSGAHIGCLPITEPIALRAALLPEIHRDPADRLIISTAIETASNLISFDAVFPNYAELQELLIGDIAPKPC